MFKKSIFKLPFKFIKKYFKLLKVLFKQTPFDFPKGSLLLGESLMIIFNNNDFVIVSIVIDDNDYDNRFNISSISLTFNNYDKHKDFGENLLLDDSESTIHQLKFSDFWLLHKKSKNQAIDLITKDQTEALSNILYNESYSEYIFFVPFDNASEKDLTFATNNFYVLSAIKAFLSKVNAKKIVRETLKIATVHYVIA